MREQVRELPLQSIAHEVLRAAARRGGEGVLAPPSLGQRGGDLVGRRPVEREREAKLGEQERIGGSLALGLAGQRLDLVPSDEVIGEVDQVDGDAGGEQRILRVAPAGRELGPRDVEGLDAGEAARPQDPALQAPSADGEGRQEALSVVPRERRDGLIADRRHDQVIRRSYDLRSIAGARS